MAPHAISHPEVAFDLAMAVIASSTAPLLLLNGDLTLIAANKSFCQAFRIDPGITANKTLAELGAGEWNVPQLTSLVKATASGHAAITSYQIDLRRDGQADRRLVINAQKLEYGSEKSVRYSSRFWTSPTRALRKRSGTTC